MNRYGRYLIIVAAAFGAVFFMWRAPSAHAAVSLDATSSLAQSAANATSLSLTSFTIGSGSNRALLVEFDSAGCTPFPTAISLTWDSGGTNQAMTFIASSSNTSDGSMAELWGLVAPTSGNKTLTATWTNNCTGGNVTLAALSVTGANQTGGATTFANVNTGTGSGSSWSLAVTSASGDFAVSNSASQNVVPTPSNQTSWYSGLGTGAVNAGSSYAAGASTVTFNYGGGGFTGGYETVGVDIVASGGGASAPTVNSFSSSPSSITLGSSTFLSWNVSNASSVAISGNNLSFSTSTLVGSASVTPTATGTLTYTLSATNPNGTSTATTGVTVSSSGGGGGSAVTLVQSATSAGNSNAVATTFSSAVTAGDTIVVLMQWGDNTSTPPAVSTITDTLGNHFVVVTSTKAMQISPPDYPTRDLAAEIAYATSSPGGSDTVTVTFANPSSGQGYSSIIETTASVLDQTAEATGTSLSPSAGTITTSQNGEFGVAALFQDDGVGNPGNIGGGSGWTLFQDASGGATENGGEYKAQASAGSITGNFTASVSATWAAGMAVFAPPSGGGGGGGSASCASSWTNGYQYCRVITASSTLISPASGTTLSNFPLLISGTFPYLEASSTAGGNGTLQNPNGYDVMFTSDSAGTTPLNYERESYSSSTGAAVYWVQVPTFSSSSNSIYMFYDNPSITTSQAHSTATWDSTFQGVWHLPDGSTLSAFDSTANAYNGTNSGATATTGKIDGAASFSSATITIGSTHVFATTTAPFSVSGWVNLTNYVSPGVNAVMELRTNTTDGWFLILSNLSGYVGLLIGSGSGSSIWAPVDTNSVIATSTWQYVAATYNGAGGGTMSNYNLYINGVLQTNNTAGGFGDTTQGTFIGNNASGGNPWSGAIDELEVSNVQRSTDWIKTQYNNQSNPATFLTIGSAQTSGGGGGSSSCDTLYLDSCSVSYFIRGETGSIFGNSASTHFGVLNSGQVLALPLMTSADFKVTSGVLSPIYKAVKPDYDQVHYQWRNDNGSETTATSATGGNEDTPLTGLVQNTSIRLRMEISNEGGTILAYSPQSFTLQYGLLSSTCGAISSWTTVGATGASWAMYNSANLTDGTSTTNIATSTGGVLDANHTFIANNYGVKDTTSTVGAVSVPSDSFTEMEFDVQALTSSTPNGTYCFRLTNAGSNTNFTYDQYPQATVASAQSITLSLGSSTVTLPGLTPGAAVKATTTATVVTNGATSGYTVSIQRNSATSTLANASSSSITFPDYTSWAPTGSTCAPGQGNGATSTGNTFSFRIASSGTTANYCTFWWGTNDAAGTAMFAGVPTTTQIIVNSTSTASQNGTTTVSIVYQANAPASQRAGSYSGGVTITAIANP